MSNRRFTWFYALLIAMTSAAAALVIASRLGLSSESSAQTVAAPAMNSAPLSGPVTATTFRDIAKRASPAVVNIRTESRQRTQDLSDFFGGGGGGGGSDLFDRFFGPSGGAGGGSGRARPERPREQLVQAAGTGFIIDKSGLILTNNHVVEGASKIKVSLYGEDEDQEYDAKIVGRDPLSDSALIELTEKPNHVLPAIEFGDSSQMQPGDWVMAIGNPFNLAHTVSVGVISALERPFNVAEGRTAQVLQTDAAINPGNSGGPLLNLRGEVIGINTAIIADGRQSGNIGIGFAIPINTVRELLPQLRTGKITRGRIGIGVEGVSREAVDEFGLKDRKGAVVKTVTPGGAASRAGFEPGDVILSYNGKPVSGRDDLVRMVVATKPGSSVPVRIMRDRLEKSLNVTVEELDLEAEGNLSSRNRERSDDTAQSTSTGFGLRLQNISPADARELKLENTRGALIADVDQGSPAARAGLRPGDIIVRVGREPIASATDAQRELGRVPSRGTAFLRVVREGQETFISVTKE
jgi:serine protease Do